jgi:6-phosphogluconolactonase
MNSENFCKIKDNVILHYYSKSEVFDKKIAEFMKVEINQGLCLVPGGFTPFSAYNILAKAKKIEPSRKVLLTDDRLVDYGSDKSNYRMLVENLKIDFRDDFPLSYYDEINCHGLTSLNEKIAKVLETSCIECSFLGLGEDSHTASLFPNHPEILECNTPGLITKNNNEDFSRFSLSYNTILTSKKIVFLVKGEDKLNALQNILWGDTDYIKFPAQKIINEHKNIYIFCDFDCPLN